MTPRRKYVLLVFLSIEPNSIRLGGFCYGIVNKILHKTVPGSLFCLSIIGPCAVISGHISSRFKGEVSSFITSFALCL